MFVEHIVPLPIEEQSRLLRPVITEHIANLDGGHYISPAMADGQLARNVWEVAYQAGWEACARAVLAEAKQRAQERDS